ncbi:protein S40-3-like [Amaranthus tricolor]|uniref:protein S40-3-like n=1 Tax=Amaranthus tricolor TaxID=29722 RepID=UPI00258E9211|nr:protein S40-3-like [Amaranthus tricolor]
MDFDEFEESEIMFSDYSTDQSVESNGIQSDDVMRWKHCSLKKKSSIAINIPVISSSFRDDEQMVSINSSFDHHDIINMDDEMMKMPPHVIIEKRDNEEVVRSFSPMKGKNLCKVRNSILRMTGFLER